MKKYLQKILFLLVGMAIVFTGCGARPVARNRMDTGMGTIVQQTIYTVGVSEAEGNTLTEEIMQCIRQLEEETLSWRLDSAELYRVNATAGSGKAVALSPKLGELLEECRDIYVTSGGAFDVTIGKVARLWQIDSWAAGENAVAVEEVTKEFHLPSKEQIVEALQYTGCEKLLLEGQEVTVPEGMQLDLGAVGKGVALDEVRKLLDRHEEISGAVISVGGSIMTYGSKPDGGSWRVGIVNPFDTSKSLGTLSLTGEWCVSTSGDYERFVEVEGVRYHHIMNPALGTPADSGVKSVTILCKDGLRSDALSTACFVLGVEKGMQLARELGAEAVFVDVNGEIYQTEGMKQYFSLSKDEK